jgi:hypothetical protein
MQIRDRGVNLSRVEMPQGLSDQRLLTMDDQLLQKRSRNLALPQTHRGLPSIFTVVVQVVRLAKR